MQENIENIDKLYFITWLSADGRLIKSLRYVKRIEIFVQHNVNTHKKVNSKEIFDFVAKFMKERN